MPWFDKLNPESVKPSDRPLLSGLSWAIVSLAG